MFKSTRPVPLTALGAVRLLSVAVLLCAVLAPYPVGAHEHREVGKYEFRVGFQNEPTYVNQPNGIWVQVIDTSVQTAPEEGAQGESEAAEGEEHDAGVPVEGLEKTLKAEVTQGSQTMSIALRQAFGEPGVYLADFIPTREGDYIFRFTGSVAGANINESFESGPEGENRFNSVQGVTALQFPEKQPGPSDLQSSLDTVRNEASQARVLGYIGIAVGAVGLLAALAAYATRRSRPGSAAVSRTTGL